MYNTYIYIYSIYIYNICEVCHSQLFFHLISFHAFFKKKIRFYFHYNVWII